MKELGAVFKCRLVHLDTYYNMPPGTRDFSDTDEALRIRRSYEYAQMGEHSETPSSVRYEFTYKGPKLDRKTKTRKELSCIITEPDIMDAILVSLGFRKILTVRKERLHYNLIYKGYRIGIVLDRVEGLDGNFAEFEVVEGRSSEIENIRGVLFGLLGEFGFSEKDSITRSYLELIMSRKRR